MLWTRRPWYDSIIDVAYCGSSATGWLRICGTVSILSPSLRGPLLTCWHVVLAGPLRQRNAVLLEQSNLISALLQDLLVVQALRRALILQRAERAVHSENRRLRLARGVDPSARRPQPSRLRVRLAALHVLRSTIRQRQVVDRVRLLHPRRPEDRKSTRLNSSHTVIYTLSLHDALPISISPASTPRGTPRTQEHHSAAAGRRPRATPPSTPT